MNQSAEHRGLMKDVCPSDSDMRNFSITCGLFVQGAGHMVPTDKPRPALEMFINFITNKPFN